MNKITTLALKDIIVEPQFQVRFKVKDEEHIQDLIEAYEGPDGDRIPDPVVYLITGKGYCLVDGFHRFEALWKLSRKTAKFVVKSGSVKDAILYACGANTDHGKKRTAKDKRRAVEEGHRIAPEISNRELAEICRVSHTFVSEVRSELRETNRDENSKSGNVATSSSKKPGKTQISPSAEVFGTTKADFYEKDDGTPKFEGVYTPRYLDHPEGEKCIDLHNNPMPDRLGDIFADPSLRKLYAEAMEIGDKLHEFWKHFDKMAKSPDFPFLELVKIRARAEIVREAFLEVRDLLREAIPAIVCPDCHGKGGDCKGRCRRSGYIARGLYDLDPAYHIRRRKN